MRDSEIRPALPARMLAWIIMFVLTVTLTVSALSGPAAANRIITSENLHVRTSTDESVIREQMDRVSGVIRDLAEDYSFSAEDVIAALSREEFETLNRETAEWWTRIVSEGVMDDIPAWNVSPQMTKAITDTLDSDRDREETAKGIANEIEKAVNRTVMPLRKALVTLAVRYVSRKTDLPGIIRFVSGIPQIAVALSLFLTGLLALLLGRRVRFTLKYFGAASTGAGISAVAGIVLIRKADFDGMIRASSEGLDRQMRTMMSMVSLETWLAAGVLIILGIICLARYNHEPVRKGKHGGAHAKRKNNSPDPVPVDQGSAELRYRRRSAQRPV